jgi:hypothetical protein
MSIYLEPTSQMRGAEKPQYGKAPALRYALSRGRESALRPHAESKKLPLVTAALNAGLTPAAPIL